MKKAVIVAFDKFTDIDVFLAWDLLNRVRIRDKEFEVKIVGTKEHHISVCGIELKTQGKIEECNNADLIFFASGPGARMEIMHHRIFMQSMQDIHLKFQYMILELCRGICLLRH